MSIDREVLSKHLFCPPQYEALGLFLFDLIHQYQGDKAGSILEWAVCTLADTGYVRKGMLTQLKKMLEDESLPDLDREYAEIVYKSVDNYDFGLSRTPKNWMRR